MRDGRISDDYVSTNVVYQSIVERPCPCNKQCLRQVDDDAWCFDDSIAVVKICRNDIRDCNFETRFKYLRSKFDHSIFYSDKKSVREDLSGEYCGSATVVTFAAFRRRRESLAFIFVESYLSLYMLVANK
jgi:hypothetical protein